MARGIRVSLAALADDVDDTPPIHTNQSGEGPPRPSRSTS